MIQPFSFKSSTGIPASGNIAPLLLGCRDFVNPTTLGYDLNGSPNLVSGALRNLTLTVNTAPGSGKSWLFTVQINGVDTGLTVTIADLNTSARTTAGDLSIADGDYISLKGTSVGSPTGFTSLWTQFEIESSAPGESQYHRNFTSSGGGYCGVFNNGVRRNSADPAVDIVPTSGSITKLRVRGQTNAGGQNHVFTVYVDSGSGFVAQDGTGGTPDTRITISVAGSYDASTTFDLPVSVGDRVYVQCVTTNGGVGGCLSTRFVADLDGESICANNTNSTLSTTGYYFPRNHSDLAPAGSDTVLGNGNLIAGAAAFSAGKLHVWLSAAPGLSKSYAFTLRKNSVSQALTCTVTGAATQTASDTTNAFNLVDADLFSMQVVSAGSPASAIGTWSFVQFIPVPSIVCTQVFTEAWVDEDAEDVVTPGPCVGGGTVASGTPVTAGTSLETATAPIVYAHIYLGGSPETILRIAGQWVPHGDPKAPYVLEWGEVERALCDSDGGPQAATQEILLFDRNGDIRAARQADTLRHAVVDVFIADLATVKANGTPWRVNRGFISKCTPAGDRTFRITITDVLTTRLNNIDGEDQQMPSLLIDETIAGLASTEEAFGKPACDLYGSFDVTGGVWQCAYVGEAAYPGRTGMLSWFLVGPGVIKVRTVFLASLNAANPNQRIQVPETSFGTYIFRPEDLTGGRKWFNFGSRRWTLIAAISGSPAIKLAREGRIPMVVECCGYESVGDGTGNTIDSPARALLHWMNNRLVQDATGDWLPLAQEGGIDLFDTASFEAVHDVLAANSSGFDPKIAGAIGFDGQKNWRDVVADFCRNFGVDLGTNRHGQVMLATLDRNDDASGAEAFDEATILEGSVIPDEGSLPVENRVRYVFRRRYDDPLPSLTPEQDARLPNDPFKADWLSGEQKVSDDDSIDALGGGTRGVRRSQVQEYGLVRDSNTAVVAAEMRRDLLSPVNGRLEGTLGLWLRHGFDLELGDVRRFKHWDFNWTGYRRCQIRRIRLNLDTLSYLIGWRDVDDLLTGFTGYLGSSAGSSTGAPGGVETGGGGGTGVGDVDDDGGTSGSGTGEGDTGGSSSGGGGSTPPVDGGGTDTPPDLDTAFYLATDGSDSNDGLSASTPWRTFAHALPLLSADDVLVVREGTYAEAISNGIGSGTDWSHIIRIVNYPGETVWLKPPTGPPWAIYLDGGQSYIEFDGINLDTTNATVSFPMGGLSFDCYYALVHHIRFKNATILMNRIPGDLSTSRVGIDFNGTGTDDTYHELIRVTVRGSTGPNSAYGGYIHTSYNLVDECDFFDLSFQCLQVYDLHNFPVGNVIARSKFHDVTASYDSRRGGLLIFGVDNVVVNCLIYNINTDGSGSDVGGLHIYNGNTNKVYGCTVTDVVGGPAILTSLATNTEIKNSIADSITDNGSGTTTATNVIGTDPLFVNPSAADYSLQAGSPARDTGTTLSNITVGGRTVVLEEDIEGTTRPQGSAYDIGAYEYA